MNVRKGDFVQAAVAVNVDIDELNKLTPRSGFLFDRTREICKV
jgi:hypothetical protein